MKRPSHPARSSTVPITTTRPSSRRRSSSAQQTSTAEGSSHKGRSLVRGEQLRRYGACTACRRRRTKCDAVRPHCGACVRHHAYLKRTQPDAYQAEDCGCVYEKREGEGSSSASVSEGDEGVDVGDRRIGAIEQAGPTFSQEEKGKQREKGKNKENRSRSGSSSLLDQDKGGSRTVSIGEYIAEEEDNTGAWITDNGLWEEGAPSRSSFSSSDTSLWYPAHSYVPPLTTHDPLRPYGLQAPGYTWQPPLNEQSTGIPHFPSPPLSTYGPQPPLHTAGRFAFAPAPAHDLSTHGNQISAGSSRVPLGPTLGHRGYQPSIPDRPRQFDSALPTFADSRSVHVMGPFVPTTNFFQPDTIGTTIPVYDAQHASSRLQPPPHLPPPDTFQPSITAPTPYFDPSVQTPTPVRRTQSPGNQTQSELFSQLHQLFGRNNVMSTTSPHAPLHPSQSVPAVPQGQTVHSEQLSRSQSCPQTAIASSRPAAPTDPPPPATAVSTGDISVEDMGTAALFRRDDLTLPEYEQLLRYVWREQGGE